MMRICECGISCKGTRCAHCAAVYRERRHRILWLRPTITRIGELLTTVRAVVTHGSDALVDRDIQRELRALEQEAASMADDCMVELLARAPRQPTN